MIFPFPLVLPLSTVELLTGLPPPDTGQYGCREGEATRPTAGGKLFTPGGRTVRGSAYRAVIVKVMGSLHPALVYPSLGSGIIFPRPR